MHRAKLAAGVIVVFVAGVLAGSLGTGIYLRHNIPKFGPGGPPPHPRTALLVKRLSRELDLTEDQRKEIEKIIRKSEIEMSAVRRKFLPEIKEITDKSFALMKETLNPDQQAKLEELHQKLRDRHAKALIQSIATGETGTQILSRMRDRLNLTEEQEVKIRPVIEESTAQRDQIVRTYKEQEHPDILSIEQEIHELESSVENRLSAILTEEQLEKYQMIQEEKRFEMRPKMH